MSQHPCKCTDRRIYACQGCSRVVNAESGIEYTTESPYPHSKWFCEIACVYRKHESILRYIDSGEIDPNDDWTLEYLEALANIEASISVPSPIPTQVSADSDLHHSFVIRTGTLRASGVVCT